MNDRSVSQIVLGVIGFALLGAGSAAIVWGLPAFLLALAGGALSLVIVLMWSSLQQMSEDGDMGFEQAISFAAPSAEEEQKRALLRTLKDLEYELSVGKISREDYEQVSAEIRDKAKRVIALADESMKERLDAAEARLAEHASAKSAKKKGLRRKRSKRAKDQQPDSSDQQPDSSDQQPDSSDGTRKENEK